MGVFVFIRYLNGAILSKKSLVKSGGFEKNIKRGNSHIRGGVVYRRRVQIFCTLCPMYFCEHSLLTNVDIIFKQQIKNEIQPDDKFQ